MNSELPEVNQNEEPRPPQPDLDPESTGNKYIDTLLKRTDRLESTDATLNRTIDHVNREIGVAQDVPLHERLARLEQFDAAGKIVVAHKAVDELTEQFKILRTRVEVLEKQATENFGKIAEKTQLLK